MGELRPVGRGGFLVAHSAREYLGHRRERILQLEWRHGLRSSPGAQTNGLFGRESERVGEAGSQRRRRGWREPPLSAGIGERDEVSG